MTDEIKTIALSGISAGADASAGNIITPSALAPVFVINLIWTLSLATRVIYPHLGLS